MDTTTNSAPETPKPARHYAVTDKVREARRLSLAKAREKAKLALRGYRRGPQEDDVAYEARLTRQIKPWCANLRHAVLHNLRNREADYATHFIHGLSAPDLDRSAAAAGEDREELRRHIERCQRTIGGLAGLRIDDCRFTSSGLVSSEFGVPSPDSVAPELDPSANTELRTPNSKLSNRQANIVNRKSKLVLALAYVFWRALRLMRTQVRWEGRALAFRLQELAAWRDRNPALTAERLNRFQNDLELVTRDVACAWGRLCGLRKRFEALWTALVDPERWERLAKHIRAPSVFPNEAMYLAPEGGGLADWLGVPGGDVSDRGRRRAEPDEGERPSLPADREPRAGAPFSGSSARWDPLERLCRTHARGAQDWRLRLDRLTAETLSLPFQSPSHVERALERQAAPAKLGARRRRDSGSESELASGRVHRLRDLGARIPDDGLLDSLAKAGKLVDISSLSVLWKLLAMGLGDRGPQAPSEAAAPAGPSARQGVSIPDQASREAAELAEALWTRLEGLRVMVDTLEEMLVRMLEYQGSGRVGAAPTFEAILKSRKAAILESRAAEDLWIDTDPFPGRSPLAGLRQWFEAAEGVLGASSRLAQKVDVALYEFAVRHFGVRREFVAWRPELSLNQWRERQGRPEWQPRVVTVEGETVLKLDDEEMETVT